MTPPTTGSIYALSDPHDGKIRYIGKTTQGLMERLAGHLSSPTNPAMRVWINGLAAAGLVPKISVVSTAPIDSLGVEEKNQIERHAAGGHPLLNHPYYRTNLAAILQGAGETEELSRRVREANAAFDKIGASLFRNLAQRRALGQVSRWALVALVAMASPAVAVWSVWAFLVRVLGLWGARKVRAAGMCCGYLWMVGCDRMVKELLLPRLPTAAVASFWHLYLESPARLIAVHLGLMALILSAFSYQAEASALLAPRKDTLR